MDQDPELQGNNPPEPTPQDNIVPVPENIPVEPSVTDLTPSPASVQTAETATDDTSAVDGPTTTPAVLTTQPAKSKHHHKSKTSKHHKNKSNPAVVYVRRPVLLVIIMVFLVLFLLAGASLAAWYFLCYNRPERVAFDAVDSFLSAPSITTDGVIKAEYNNTSIMLTLASENVDLSGSSKMTLTISPLDANGSVIYEQPYQVEIGTVFMTDGMIYLRVDDLMDTVDQYLEDHALTKDDFDIATALGYEAADLIDGEWWQISVPDLIDMYADSAYDARPAKELYACMVNVGDRDIKHELAQLYSDHRFVNIEKIKHPESYSSEVASGFNSLYSVSFDYGRMASFINALSSSETAQSVYNCLNHYSDSTDSGWQISADSFNEISAEELRESFSGLESLEFEITNFGHQLVGISASHGQNLLGLKFQYQANTIVPPNRYHRFTELMEELTTAMLESFGSSDDLDYTPDFYEWNLIDQVETT